VATLFLNSEIFLKFTIIWKDYLYFLVKIVQWKLKIRKRLHPNSLPCGV